MRLVDQAALLAVSRDHPEYQVNKEDVDKCLSANKLYRDGYVDLKAEV